MKLLRLTVLTDVIGALGLLAVLGPVVSVSANPIPVPHARELVYPSHIRVRLAEATPLVQIRGNGLYISENGRPRQLLTHEDSEWELRCQAGRIRAVPTMGGGITRDLVEPVILHATSGQIQFRGRPYREEIEVHSVGSLCEVVNHVELEKYLGGLVNSEFNSKWNEESIGAQIVAARTYALYQISMARGDSTRRYDVDATTRDQVYDGTIKEDPRAQRLVEHTRGWVLTTGAGAHPAALKAFYHSTCGGITELPEHVWGNSFAGFKRAVRCPYCGGSPALNWQLELTTKEVIEAFRRAWVSSDDPRPEWSRSWPQGWQQALAAKQLVGVRAGLWDREGRVSEVITTWTYVDKGIPTMVELSVVGARFREWVGPSKFRSASFHIIGLAGGNSANRGPASGTALGSFAQLTKLWRFQGRGNGHGVGMCQWGAKTMGERGFKTAAILKHYYPDAILRKLW